MSSIAAMVSAVRDDRDRRLSAVRLIKLVVFNFGRKSYSVCLFRQTDRQTDGRTDARPLHSGLKVRGKGSGGGGLTHPQLLVKPPAQGELGGRRG